MSTDAKAPPLAPGRGGQSSEPGPAIRRRKASKAPYYLILPAIIILLVALGYPVGWQIITSFQKFGLMQQFGGSPEFVGFENYIALLGTSELWVVLGRSLLFCLLSAFLTVAIGGLLALLMQRVGTAARLMLQVSMLLAWAMPVVAAMTVWVWLIDWRRGVLNWLLVQFGIDAEGHNWLADPVTFFLIAVVIVVWMSVPFVALSLYAGLTQISGEVLEAAGMDGATGWQRTRYIILPLIAPVLSIVLLLQLIWDLRVFTQIKLLQDAGGVANETNMLGTFIYQLGVGSGDFGMASAVSILMLILTIGISWYYVRSLMKEEN
ncbi:carbohydrate ABC transporter permease [Arthrobacter psychrochitiniphilus]|uniref:Sugar ABC transporter permease n=1 Tax=Arthrobacter psychrochitiniphilus TaxID=291045 RepID=A0A2V3DV55_9MICC|nr:sugar ABC transporter permease [Arthrobacter psychrochitiniphilus]NYG16702.1 N,N'-diacetylchitobiose transport system permease protein [Arthrobacter psychrochitiniphilus]PXA69189.1 sugar ABC transporter permease [Arthrobacter psychrochitiniphilus]